mgnify:CR=1 FL=1
MKRVLSIFIIMAMAAAFAIAQTSQTGYVKTKGRMDSKGQLIPGTRLSGASIVLTGGHSTVSGGNGNFTLTIPEKKFFLKNVQKQGYQLVDQEILGKQYLYSANPLVITMETPEKLLEDQLKSERKLRRSLQQQLQKKEMEIDSLVENNKITEEEYHKALQKLYADQEKNEKLISDMAKRYSEIDYDQLDEFYRQVTFCIENGDLVKADSLLSSRGDVRKQVEEQLQKGQAIQEQKEQLQKAEEVFAADNDELARRCFGYYEKFFAQFQNDSAAYYLELRANLDTTNPDWQNYAGRFIAEYLALYDKAMFYYQRALRKATQNNDSKVVAECYHHIGAVYSDQGNYAKALEYFQKALGIRKEKLGNDHSDVASCYNNIGAVYNDQGDYTKALECYQTALDIWKRVLGEDHPMVALCHHNMGVVYKVQGDYPKALEHYQKALGIRKRVYGEDHLLVALCYYNIGVVYKVQGNYPKALENYQKALGIRKQKLGETHPDVASCYNNIGIVYQAQGDYAKALEYYQKTLTVKKQKYGNDHMDVAMCYHNMGTVYEDQGNYAKALKNYQTAMDISKRVLGEEHSTIVLYYKTIGDVYFFQEDYNNALKCYQNGLDLGSRVLEKNHPVNIQFYNMMAYVYFGQGDYDEAIKTIDKAIALSPQDANLYDSKGEFLLMEGDDANALKMWEKVMQIDPDYLIKNNGYSELYKGLKERGHIK